MNTQADLGTNNTILGNSSLAELLNDFSIDAIIAIDPGSKVIAWNRTAAIVYGHSKKQVLGKSLSQVIPGIELDAETIKAIDQALKGHKTFVPASTLYAHRKHREIGDRLGSLRRRHHAVGTPHHDRSARRGT